MPTCRYCGESFESEAEEIAHLESEHRDELGMIDRRRIGGSEDASDGSPLGIYVIVATLAITVAIVAYVGFFAGEEAGSNGQADGEPYNIGGEHTHGTMEVTIAGETFDLESPEFGQDPAFHFHPGYYDEFGVHIYHIHAEGLTLQYALGTLGIDISDDGSELTFEGETYRDDDPNTEIIIEVDGESKNPGEYVLEGVGPEDEAAAGAGDSIVVEVITDDE